MHLGRPLCKCRYLRIAAVGADRSEGPEPAFLVEMRMVQKLDHFTHP